MKIGIMQPYFMPYIGYWQLIHAVDTFVLYDNIEFTKKGWINRNRVLLRGAPHLFTVPVKKGSDFAPIFQREIAENKDFFVKKTLRTLFEQYKRAPFFEEVYPLCEKAFLRSEKNLFYFIAEALFDVLEYLEVKTEIIPSSALPLSPSKGKDKVIEIVKYLGGDVYVNAIGGQKLYDKEEFKNAGIELFFLKSNSIEYEQNCPFVPHLSIIDVLFWNGRKTRDFLQEFTLI